VLFLAGGITDCPNWQHVAVQLVRQAGIDWVILNPRRRRAVDEENAVAEQVAWESRHLRLARAILSGFRPRRLSSQLRSMSLGGAWQAPNPLPWAPSRATRVGGM
jgi:hypothetical protein